MTIYHISDIHADMHLSRKFHKAQKTVGSFVDQMVHGDHSRDTLIIAGDISNYQTYSKLFLDEVSRRFRQILVVPGNHDLYIMSREQRKTYPHSMDRIRDLRAYYKNRNVHFLPSWLDGPTRVEGLMVAGEMMVSDPYCTVESSSWYKKHNNDYKNIDADVLELNRNDMSRYQAHVDNRPDIFVSHWATEYTPRMFQFEQQSKYSFMTPVIPCAPVMIFGHTHERISFEKDDSLFLSNAVGNRDLTKIKAIV